MKRDQALAVLRNNWDRIARDFGVRTIALFGSTARDEADARSDIDILVAFDGPATFDGYTGLKDHLEDLLGSKVDLVIESGLKPRARTLVQRDAILVA